MRCKITHVLACLLLVLTLSACMEQQSEGEAPVGQVERTETIEALNLVLVTNGEAVARLVGTLINEAAAEDRLIGVDVDTEIGEFSVIVADAPIVLPTDEQVRLAREAAVTVLSDALRPGFRARLTLVFRNSDPIVTTVPVMLQEGIYEDVEVMEPPDGDIAPD